MRTTDASPTRMLRSPYRCRDCGNSFWVTSRKFYYLEATFGAMIIAAAIGLVVSSDRGSRPGGHEPEVLAPAQFASTIKLAESGDPAAEHQMAQIHAVGDGVPKNEKEAVRWLERAAGHGDADAQYELGLALREGRGTLQDDERAFAWLQRAANVGNAPAQFELGRMYFVGAGTPVDKIQAYTWLNLAAAQGAVGAASLRDTVRGQLSADEIVRAQAEARRLSESQSKQATKRP
jgi:TPR repeat protein